MYKVAVLMSTYNGDKYLKEQIDSILAQEGVELTLYIRDDGSMDKTIEIIEEYMKVNSNIRLTKGKNVGVGNSFMQLVYDAPDDYDYYAFSDQDDIWDKDKLSEAILRLKGSGKSLYASNQECIDQFGNTLGLRYAEDADIHLEPLEVLQSNMLAGCTFVFDYRLKEILSSHEHRPSRELLKNRIHDVWVINVASLINGVYYDKKSHMRYRQHATNVVGAYTRSFSYNFKLKLKKLHAIELRNGRSKLGKELYQCFPEATNISEIYYACTIANQMRGKMILLKNLKKLRKTSAETAIGLILKILLNFF